MNGIGCISIGAAKAENVIPKRIMRYIAGLGIIDFVGELTTVKNDHDTKAPGKKRPNRFIRNVCSAV